MPSTDYIPLIDFSAYSLEIDDRDSVCTEQLQQLSHHVYDALSTVGFCYLQNHGFPQDKLDAMLSKSRSFFELEAETKRKYAKNKTTEHGWVAPGQEYFDPSNPVGDYKECFNYIPHRDYTWESVPVQDIRQACREFHERGTELAMRILDVITLAFIPEHRDFLRECHAHLGKEGNERYVRSLYYPPPTDNITAALPRCGEHTDYGSLTVLWQDATGGLEVKTASGEYTQATPIPGTVLINIGDLMQRWTADKLVATVHRVVPSPVVANRKRPRQSIAFFTGPDDDVTIKCLDGSNKYPPITSSDFYTRRFSETYFY